MDFTVHCNPYSNFVLQAHLALYCFANNQVSSALRLMYRTRYLALVCHGENHPEVGLIDVSTATKIQHTFRAIV